MIFEKPIELWALLFEYALATLAPRVERGKMSQLKNVRE